MEKFYYKRKLIGIRIKKVLSGSIPQTPDDWALQLVTLKHLKGTTLAAHYHRPRKRITNQLQEGLFVKKGKIRLDLYGPDQKYYKRIYLTEGQCYLTLCGGLGIHILEDAELYEFKNGPFLEDKVLI